MSEVEFTARNIVSQLFDEADVGVDKRQEINDKCDEFVVKLIGKLLYKANKAVDIVCCITDNYGNGCGLCKMLDVECGTSKIPVPNNCIDYIKQAVFDKVEQDAK